MHTFDDPYLSQPGQVKVITQEPWIYTASQFFLYFLPLLICIQVPTSLLRQSQHHHSLSTPSPLPTPPPSASGPGPSPCASQASPTHSQVKKNRYVEIDVFPDSNYSSPRSLVIKKSSSAGSVSRLEGNIHFACIILCDYHGMYRGLNMHTCPC